MMVKGETVHTLSHRNAHTMSGDSSRGTGRWIAGKAPPRANAKKNSEMTEISHTLFHYSAVNTNKYLQTHAHIRKELD